MDSKKLADPKTRQEADVGKMFGRIAPSYDKINRAMCFGLDILWRKKLVKYVLKNGEPKSVFDCACGSGDVSIELAKKFPNAKIIGGDFCEEMLELAKEKASKQNLKIEFLFADCQKLPFEDSQFDAVTISFGFRNFKDRNSCLKEIVRVLKPNGILAILEVAKAEGIFQKIQKIFMGKFVPSVAKIFGGQKADYEYLAETTFDYPSNFQVKQMLLDAGLKNPKIEKLAFGLVAISSAEK